MPAAKVKKRSSMDPVQCLHSCHKSSKTSRSCYHQVKPSQGELAAHDSTQDSMDVNCNIEVSSPIGFRTKASTFPDSFAGDSSELPRIASTLSCDHPTLNGRTVSLSATSPPILETIFSPIFKSDDSVRDVENPGLPHLVADDSDDGSCSSSDLQTCSVSDFYICESANDLTFDDDMAFADIVDTTLDYEPVNNDIALETPERFVILPFLDKTLETSDVDVRDSIEDAELNSDDAGLYLAIHQMKSSDQETEIAYHYGDLGETECFDPHLIFRNLPDLPEAVSSIGPVLLPKETRKRKSVTLVLDLDETLVHSTLEHCDNADFSFPVFFNMKQHMVYVKRRPYLQMFLEAVAQMFETVIFTASQSIYAEELLDILDPDGNLIGRRIYRESCIFSDGSYTKDLTILGVDLAKVAIIDNSPQVFRLQVNNGIPIKSWFDDPSDQALISLLPFLETLVDAEDVRPIIAKRFGTEE